MGLSAERAKRLLATAAALRMCRNGEKGLAGMCASFQDLIIYFLAQKKYNPIINNYIISSAQPIPKHIPKRKPKNRCSLSSLSTSPIQPTSLPLYRKIRFVSSLQPSPSQWSLLAFRQYKFYSSLVHEFTIVKIEMMPSNHSLPVLRYSVLKPNPAVSLLRCLFARPHPRCQYELAAQDGLSLRKYRRVVNSLDSIIQDYQWRHEQPSPIVHCLYIELVPPSAARGLALDIYIEDMECTLAGMKRLLLPEALFLIMGAVEGYGAIHERFKQVSICEQTIGLGSNGNCMVWTNPLLERNQSDASRIKVPQEIAAEVVALVREKSEPVCEGVLGKLLELLAKQAGDFRKIGEVVESFAKSCKAKVPHNLRYLVHQQRLAKNCEGTKTQRTICEEKQRNPFNSRRFVFSRNSLASLRVLSPRENCKSSRGIASTLRKTTSPDSNLRTFSSKRQQNNKSIDSSILQEDAKTSKVHPLATGRQKLFAFPHFRSKSQAHQCIQIINNIRPKKEAIARSNGQIDQDKKASNISDNAKTAESFNRSKTNHTADSEERSHRGLVCQQIIFSPNNKASSFGLYKECQSYECSPFIIKEEEPNTSSTNLLSQSSDLKFQSIPEFFRANKWTPVLKNLMEARTNLQHSVTEGQDACHYLSDVRLQKLDCLGKHMAVSLIPERSARKVDQ